MTARSETLKLYLHPLSSYCHKALIALYEGGLPFEPVTVELQKEDARAAFLKVWPMGQFPVLQAGDKIIPESTIIIEYLAANFPALRSLVPEEPSLALEVRLRDRFFDLHVHTHMQRIVGDRLRPEGGHDPIGVEQARGRLATALDWIETDMRGKQWAVGDIFTMADCSAAPALFYANMVRPLDGFPVTVAYLERLKARPSYARVLKEAEPYFSMFPR